MRTQGQINYAIEGIWQGEPLSWDILLLENRALKERNRELVAEIRAERQAREAA